MTEGTRTDDIQGRIVHVYDDIEEADNALPLWWLATFYGSILFAVGYWFAYHEFGTLPLPNEAYAAEMSRRAASGGEVTEETLVALAGASTEVSRGRTLFDENCKNCHGDRGQGQIGPNLTDDAWLHGGTGVAIFHTIRDGVTDKGMPAWGNQLGPEATRQLAAFVMSIRGQNLPGKEPQGTPSGTP